LDPATATPICFRNTEIEADQAVRFQSELMVVSDSCRAGIYRGFTIRNRELIAAYQQEMIEHFRRNGAHNPEAYFDRFITKLANDFSLQAGSEPLAAFCSRSAAFLAQADGLDDRQFRRYVAQLAAERRGDYLRCAGGP
jgi:hypothetical protein